jgi:hypothetical protein
VRGLALLLAALASGCALGPDGPTARIADDVALTLPTPPDYPEQRTIVQTGRARYGELQAAFEAVISLAPERTEIVLAVVSGPRLATIVWDEEGVREDRTLFAPVGVPVENILADIFVAVWPAEAVEDSLPDGVSLTVDENGTRTIGRDGVVIMTVAPDAADASRTLVRNDAFGYEVAIVSQTLDP